MALTEREVDKLTFVLNRVYEKLGFNANEDGFSYDDDLNIFMKGNDYKTIDLESGLDFLIDEIGEKDMEEE